MAKHRKPARKCEYVEGSTVRKLTTAHVAAPKMSQRQAGQLIREKHRVRRNREKALQMDLPYVIALTLAAVCAMCICVNYLQLQTSITGGIREIQNLEQRFEALKVENDVLENRISLYVDLDNVYQVATEELGMVYANKNQIILYNKTESEYVRQNEDIPKY